MASLDSVTEQLLQKAIAGSADACGELLERHRQRLERMIDVRMDRRLAARLDAADVVQDALAEAVQRLSEYWRERSLPFYPWLRQLAWDRLAELHRRHVGARKRTVLREERWEPELPDESAAQLADRLAGRTTSPSARLARAEECERVRLALTRLSGPDREVLVLRHLEQLSLVEIAAVLGVTENTAGRRHLRALERLRTLLSEPPGEENR
jgi:RNA polymerase sigma-70 factor (ECF subfamily)